MGISSGNRTKGETVGIYIDGTIRSVTVRRRAGLKYMRLCVFLDEVFVTVPAGVKSVSVAKLLAKKQMWLTKQLRVLQQAALELGITRKNCIYYQGQPHQLRVIEEAKTTKCRCYVRLSDNVIILYLTPEDQMCWQPILLSWMRTQAKSLIRGRLEVISDRLRCQFRSVRIRDQKTKWGSCSLKRNLSFNWRLALMPPEVMDYVIIHELCHLMVMNHSQRFWLLVTAAMPEFEKHRQWLRNYGHIIGRIPNNIEVSLEKDAADCGCCQESFLSWLG